MAHKKGEGSTQNGRDSNSKRLGVKLFGGEGAFAGNIIIRQRGTRFHAGENVYMGKDFTLHAAVDGQVAFRKGRRNWTFVSIVPFGEVAETIAPMPPKKEEKVEIAVAKTVKVAAPPVVEETPEAPVEVAATPAAEETPEAPVEGAATPAAEEAEAEIAAPAAKKAATATGDDLKKVEGIGPKIASLLNDAEIFTFADLAAADPEKIREILEAAGSRYRMHDPGTWPQQAALAAEGKWDELQALQDELKGGKVEE